MPLSKGRGALLAGGLGVSLLALMVPSLGSTASAAVQKAPRQAKITHLRARYDVGVRSGLTRAELATAAAAGSTVPMFSSSVTDPQNKKTYDYNMVGTNPEVKGSSSSTTVKTFLVPVDLVYSSTLFWDPTVKDSCDTGASALSRTQASPIFVNRSWSFGGTAITSSGQYLDAFQRANFWSYTKPTGANPGFGIQLSAATLPKLTVKVPSSDIYTAANTNCGNKVLPEVSYSWLDGYLRNTAIPSLASKGVNATTLPIFVFHNVVLYYQAAADCCILGYHGEYSHSGAQTYIFSDYDNSGAFTGFSDVAGMSHETGEWMDDPYGTNPTAPWGHIGQVSGCQSNLEVGDPLSGTIFGVKTGSFTYHLQQLAFFSWFYRQTPSLGVNGWYSDLGKFKTPAAACS